MNYYLLLGDFECFKAAVQNGADSIYFGASNFNARASATNFNLDNLKETISYAKLRGVKTHLTLNTLIKEDEFEDAILIAKKAYEYGIDAIIVQDLGLAKYLIKTYPDLPIHASTQMTIHNLDGVLKAQELGFKRVVLARELSIEEISHICSHSKVEIETFIHGALCISYSGQCLFSSMVGGRSGNRGKCAQPCRLPYKLIEENIENNNNNNEDKDNKKDGKTLSEGYLLSPRDLMGLYHIPELIEAGVTCFKIEGRMKSPEYVATVTRIYRKYIDLAYSDKPYKVEKKDIDDLMQVFNRGNFSSGHLETPANKKLIYPDKQNHMGIYIGNVSNIKPSKGHILINLTNSISIGDVITFEKEDSKYNVSELMIKSKNVPSAEKGQFVEVGRMKGNINIGDKIYKLSSKELSNEAKASYQGENRKVKLNASIALRKNKPIILTLTCSDKTNSLFKDIMVTLSSNEVPIEAKNRPIDQEKILAQLNKTNDTIFEFEDIKIDLEENIFLPSYKVLNELRRNALDKMVLEANKKILRKPPTSSKEDNSKQKKIKIKEIKENKRKISVLINNLNENFEYENLKNVDRIYIPLKYFAGKRYINTIKTITDNFDTYIYLPTIIKTNYKNLLNAVIDKSVGRFNIKGFVVSGLGNAIFMRNIFGKSKEKYVFLGNYTLNVYNSKTAYELKNLGISKLTISPELDEKSIKNLLESSPLPHELIVYGRTPLMNIKYCFLGNANKCHPECGSRCTENKDYYLKDRLGLKFPVYPDNIQTVTTIYNSKITSINGSEFNVSSYRIDILDETIDEINNIIDIVKSNNRLEGRNYTSGNLNREI